MKYNRITFEGKTYSGEVWSSGFALADVTVPVDDGIISDYDDLLAWAQAVFDQMTNVKYGFLMNALSTTGNIERVRAEARDGSALLQAAESSGTAKAGSTSPTQPAQVASVISFKTGRPGRSYRGRMYWPSLTASLVAATGKMTSGLQAGLLSDAVKLVKAVRDEANTIVGGGSDMQPVVYSSVLDLVTPVTTLQVGDVLDTQRRRRDKLSEAYVEASVL